MVIDPSFQRTKHVTKQNSPNSKGAQNPPPLYNPIRMPLIVMVIKYKKYNMKREEPSSLMEFEIKFGDLNPKGPNIVFGNIAIFLNKQTIPINIKNSTSNLEKRP